MICIIDGDKAIGNVVVFDVRHGGGGYYVSAGSDYDTTIPVGGFHPTKPEAQEIFEQIVKAIANDQRIVRLVPVQNIVGQLENALTLIANLDGCRDINEVYRLIGKFYDKEASK